MFLSQVIKSKADRRIHKSYDFLEEYYLKTAPRVIGSLTLISLILLSGIITCLLTCK